MQLDFHHAVTYVVARLAGMAHSDAVIVAYSAQYVDDATNKGTVRFTDGTRFERIASAHEITQIEKNLFNALDFSVWVPFHFLPGNNGAQAGQEGNIPKIQKLLCQPDSPIANEMIQSMMGSKQAPNALHRLGITIHVYADTWAHRRFAGIRNEVNQASSISYQNMDGGDAMLEAVKAKVGAMLDLGHGGVGTAPDLPFLEWSYVDGFGKPYSRRNWLDFMDACRKIFHLIIDHQGLSSSREIKSQDTTLLSYLFCNLRSPDPKVRHTKWVEQIEGGSFSFGKLSEQESSDLDYRPKGVGSWKYEALGVTGEMDIPNIVYPANPNFKNTNWKKFHDAIKEHQACVLRIINRYGIQDWNV